MKKLTAFLFLLPAGLFAQSGIVVTPVFDSVTLLSNVVTNGQGGLDFGLSSSHTISGQSRAIDFFNGEFGGEWIFNVPLNGHNITNIPATSLTGTVPLANIAGGTNGVYGGVAVPYNP